MDRNESKPPLSASDLSSSLGCRHRVALNLAVAQGQIDDPTWVDPMLSALQERGREQERRYLDSLVDQGIFVLDLSEQQAAAEKTLTAMQAGTPVIVQAVLRREHWYGRADLLRRVEVPSTFGNWSYEVIDSTLAFTTHNGALLQLLLFCDLLREVQGVSPKSFHLISQHEEWPIETFRLSQYSAYFRLLRSQIEDLSSATAHGIEDAHYPEPTVHCDGCTWEQRCDRRRRQDDHLSLVAGLSRLHRRELEAVGIRTLTDLGRLSPDFRFKPRNGGVEPLLRAREQARIQLAAREAGALTYELLPIVANRGIARLPEPQPGDVFLSIKGDPFITGEGREYLFGLLIVEADGTHRHASLWAVTTESECATLERVVAEIERSLATHPDAHIYHYGRYEPLALKRLTGRHGRCESSLDRLLRRDRFVDLQSIVQNGMRASVERYSFEQLEPFYQFERRVPRVVARQALRVLERALEFGSTREFDDDARFAAEGYIADNCRSACGLRDWLERLRAQAVAMGTKISRPASEEDVGSEEVRPGQALVDALVVALTADVPIKSYERCVRQQASWLLAQLVDWHRRESKAGWWEFFRLWELADHELLDEKAALSELTFLARVGGTARSPIDRYTFPDQEAEIGRGDSLLRAGTGERFGTVAAIDPLARTVDIKKRGDQAEEHPNAVFSHDLIRTSVLEDALLLLAADIANQGMDNTTNRAAADLLCVRAPRLLGGERFEQAAKEDVVDFAARIVTKLDHTVLVVQGPPGAGKTFTAAKMICALVKQGMRVGVAAQSHRLIANLLEAVLQMADRSGISVACAQKVAERVESPGRVARYTSNEDVDALLGSSCPPVVGGTAWLWARPTMRGKVDVLFVEEAGQMSLANALVVSHCARSLVLLGDPWQLEQPPLGSHPPGADCSAIDHMLQGHQTVPLDRGIFLPETWRLPPKICAFTSEVFYEEKLRSRAGLERREIRSGSLILGSGLWVLPVTHDGNQDAAVEEADAIEDLLNRVLTIDADWVDSDNGTHSLRAEDVMVIAPYNAHVALLSRRLGSRGIRVGTVDRFQGQEALLVIYSMATSTPEDAPRGMEFLYSLNRLNVATSRARCACILVASPRLFTPECKTPRQMALANALCRYVEMATRLPSSLLSRDGMYDTRGK